MAHLKFTQYFEKRDSAGGPLAKFKPALDWIKNHYRAEVELVAAGAQNMSRTIQIGRSHAELHGATLLTSGNTPDDGASNREIPVRRLDTLAIKHRLVPPIMIKVDTQGTELDVMAGAAGILACVDVVILEVSFFQFWQQQPLVDETLQFMSARDFFPYDIFGGYNRPLDNALGQLDIAFVRRNGLFRKDQRYADPNTLPSFQQRATNAVRRFLRV